MFKKGDKVVQVLPAPIEGSVAGFDVDQETGAVQVRVEWPDADGSIHAQHFREDQLKAVEDAPAAE
ncbi:hypothetical protein [Rhodoferax sp. GW822-FHT02A01]|uniref:hypothetical protein n=1 Tax=Rhodoferax sp. GW822-FHT02A01 TaxID=3141537 RepID=UPI00315DF9CD